MQEQSKKVIYYYYDEAGNRRPLDFQVNDGYDLMIQEISINKVLKKYPYLKNNFYALIDGIEFKID
ncbi:hypothetical protein [Staphylococcus pseudintermedius]|uniref:hypothetical protein n=1 Tax=Staphylococcus pseudintermedius TaxID=283734 RepID=UPI0010C3F1D9|nr:hypothetical protein [Staphylococcus pseudintermedius]AZB66695.1 hypothetical protein [Staphylococcus phage phiSP119-1]EGQ1664727.1 hypothetical protein [Staphylococcus pseudintermedius]EGQ1685688.1 hypothetical protein [Staphylococcus pseudintermedius]EGQ2875387.1 hypothetical protein [Staphylococcus pseudintermedius]EGQ3323183.1 hypothetical protein [Staphylococcus pseudintermedius]